MEANAGDTLILVVEDEEPLLRLSTHVLEMAGFRVMPVAESEAALHKARSRRDEAIHVLVTDLRMDPHMSGARLAHLLRHDRPGLRVVYMSGYPMPESVRKEAAAGAAVILPKPFTPTALLEAVRKALEPSPADARA